MSYRDDESTPMNRAPSLMSVAVDVARTREQVKYLVERIDDREEQQKARDEHFRESMRLVVREAVEEAVEAHVAPLAAKVEGLEKSKLKLGAIAGAAGALLPLLGWCAEHFHWFL
ncbi:MAG: hypothetical protein RLZZ450_96 [Pseudomonadota bacterium]|jgi:flagellar motor component MotA